MSSEVRHIHLGAGCLGLGLVVSSSCRAGLDVHVVVAEDRSLPRPPTFELDVVGGANGSRAIEAYTVAGFWQASSLEQLPDALREVLLHSDHLLLTTSLTTRGFTAAQPFVLEMLDARAVAGHARSTTFIAAENDPGPTWEPFQRAVRDRGVRVCRTMVNRYCPLKTDEFGPRRVRVDVEQEWVIELTRLPIPPPLAALAALPHVELVTNSDVFEKRKLWLINGSHLALAIMARSTRNVQEMNLAAAEPGRMRWVLALQHELADVLREMELALGDEAAYGSRHFASVLRHEDKVGRILRRLVRHDLVPFFEDFRLKLGEAMLWQVTRSGGLSRTFREVLDELQKLLLNFDAFEDAADIREGVLWMSNDVDQASLAAYGAMIGELMPAELVGDRTRVLAHVWKRQRERFERRSGHDRRVAERRRAMAPAAGQDRRGRGDRRSWSERRKPIRT